MQRVVWLLAQGTLEGFDEVGMSITSENQASLHSRLLEQKTDVGYI